MSMRNRFAVLVLAAVAVTAACGGGEKQETQAPPPPAGEAAAPPAATTGAAAPAGSETISGKVTFDGTVPPAEKVKLSADPKCAEMHKDGMEKQPIQVKDGGLANVFVYVKSGVSGTFPAPTEPAVIDQKGCNYTPHIVTMQTNQPLKIKNDDDTLHNIHPRPTVNAEFNIGQPRKGMESTKTFDKKEVMFPVGCDVHPWMRAYISVLDHPFYAVTKEDGTFEIKGLPPGDYEVEAYHEKLKTQTQKVTVKAGEPAKVDFAFKG
jgi:carboxypeptidase family protein